MPADQRRWLHDDDGLTPVEPAGEPDQGHSSRLRGTTWRDLAFLVEGQLFAQKEVLCRQGRTRAQAQAQEAPRIHEEHQRRACAGHEIAKQVRTSSHGQGIPLRDTLWFPLIVVLLQEWLVICYNEPDNIDSRSPEGRVQQACG